MSRTIPRPKITLACKHALEEAEETYREWTGGVSMRAAPESFVQTLLAKKLHSEFGISVLLEASVEDIRKVTSGEQLVDPEPKGGRIDIVAYYKSAEPRFLIELKKLTRSYSLKADTERIRELMKCNSSIQNGLLVAYTMAVKEATVLERLSAQAALLGIKQVQTLDARPAKSRRGKDRVLAGAVYRVDREA